MKAKILLADYAKVSDGKVDALGMGWTVTSSPTPPAAVVIFFEVGWDETDRKFPILLELLDADGQPVDVPGPGAAAQPFRIKGEIEARRPQGTPTGTPVDVQLAINLGPGMPLTPGQRYEWRLSVNDSGHEDWTARFLIREQHPQAR